MSTSLAALDALPSIVDFYAHYCNKRPFLVRDAIDQTVMDGRGSGAGYPAPPRTDPGVRC